MCWNLPTLRKDIHRRKTSEHGSLARSITLDVDGVRIDLRGTAIVVLARVEARAMSQTAARNLLTLSHTDIHSNDRS